ncbi:MAG: energy transducer TonB [Ignavibacteriales bacterium]|nr:MAG: energy transducer TonB [Ignavibacteriales bacterium]
MGLLKKIVKPETRFNYKVVIKLSFILSLSVMIFAFKFFPYLEKGSIVLEGPQELFTVEDIQQTIHEKLPPPPPPKPNIIIAAPSDELLEDVDISSTEIDFTEEVSAPPPPKKENIVIEEEPTFFVAVEEMPTPVGGIAAIQSRIKYPEIARRAGLEGTVYILAYLSEEGVVVKTEIAKGIGGGCDEEAEKAVKETRFTPGKQRGKPVKVKVMIPVKFQLKDVS